MADFSLKVSKQDYSDKLALLEHAISELASIRQEYHSLMNQLNSDVMETVSDDFAQLEADVNGNIMAVEKSLRRAEQAREAVATTLQGYEDLSANTGNLLSSAGSAIEEALNLYDKTTSLF